MSKKNRLKKFHSNAPVSTSEQVNAALENETSNVRKDMLQTVIVNLLFIALLIGLYYINESNGQFLNSFVAKFIKL